MKMIEKFVLKFYFCNFPPMALRKTKPIVYFFNQNIKLMWQTLVLKIYLKKNIKINFFNLLSVFRPVGAINAKERFVESVVHNFNLE